MKEVLESLSSKHLFTSFVSLDTSFLKTRRKMVVYKGVDTKHCFHIIFDVAQKSRFGLKHTEEILRFEEQLALHVEHAFKYKHLIVDAPMCSKALKVLEAHKWSVVC